MSCCVALFGVSVNTLAPFAILSSSGKARVTRFAVFLLELFIIFFVIGNTIKYGVFVIRSWSHLWSIAQTFQI